MNFSVDWTTAHEAQFNRVLRDLALIDSVRILEIGSYEGRTTKWFSDRLSASARVVCVDPHPKASFFENLQIELESGRVQLIKEKSEIALNGLAPLSFDFVYLDGSHFGFSVMSDLVRSWDLLKPGGLLLADDYEWIWPEYVKSLLVEDPRLNEQDFAQIFYPRYALDCFVALHQLDSEVVHKGYQLLLKKTCHFNKKWLKPDLQPFCP